jgi:hypothetical protein
MCSNWLFKKSIISSPFALLIFNVKILSNFQNKWCTFGRKKKGLKKKDCAFLRFECFEHVKTFLICVKLWTYVLCNQWKIFLRNFCQFKLLCFPCDFSNIQNCSFMECPFTWMAPLIVFAHLHPHWFLFKSFENGGWFQSSISFLQPC